MNVCPRGCGFLVFFAIAAASKLGWTRWSVCPRCSTYVGQVTERGALLVQSAPPAKDGILNPGLWNGRD